MNIEPIKKRRLDAAIQRNTYLKRKRRCSSAKIRHASGLSAMSHILDLRLLGYSASAYVCPECEFIHVTTS